VRLLGALLLMFSGLCFADQLWPVPQVFGFVYPATSEWRVERMGPVPRSGPYTRFVPYTVCAVDPLAAVSRPSQCTRRLVTDHPELAVIESTCARSSGSVTLTREGNAVLADIGGARHQPVQHFRFTVVGTCRVLPNGRPA